MPPATTEPTHWATELGRRAHNSGGILTPAEAGLGADRFAKLDVDRDVFLTAVELAGCVPGGTFDRIKLPRTVLAASHGYPQAFGIDMRGGPAWFRAMDKDGDVSRKEFTGPPEARS